MATDEASSERTAVRTYIPMSQRDTWDDHAAELGMSRSEFIRTMVQAGRRGFNPGGHAPRDSEDRNGMNGSNEQRVQSENTGGGNRASVDDQILSLLDEGACLSWDELYESLTEDIEVQLEESLSRLQTENRIEHSGRRDGYVRIE